jgi:hypothetical protein
MKRIKALLVAAALAFVGVLAAPAIAAPRLSPPTITSAPTPTTSERFASFTYTDKGPITRFQCSLDGSAYGSCGTKRPSTKSYPGPLSIGSHRFVVRAIAGKRASSPTSYIWKVSDDHFRIIGDVCCLSPGTWRPIDVTVTNPNSYKISVTGVTSAVSASPAGCDASSNIAFKQSPISSSHAMSVSPKSSATIALADQPQIQLINLPVNQDACQSKVFTLEWTGTANAADTTVLGRTLTAAPPADEEIAVGEGTLPRTGVYIGSLVLLAIGLIIAGALMRGRSS